MKTKIKKFYEDSQLPTYAHSSDAGMDLYVHHYECDPESNIVTYHTGIGLEIPEGYVGLVFARSSIYKTGQIVSNGVGVVDCGYTGEILLKTYLVDNNVNKPIVFKKGERCGQMIIMPYPKIELELVDELSKSERGDNGHGSTGK